MATFLGLLLYLVDVLATKSSCCVLLGLETKMALDVARPMAVLLGKMVRRTGRSQKTKEKVRVGISMVYAITAVSMGIRQWTAEGTLSGHVVYSRMQWE